MTRFDVESLADHEEGFRRLAYQILRDESQVDDIVQDAYLAALESTKLPARSKRLAWFRSVVRNIALMRLRSQSRRRRNEKRGATSEAYESAPDDAEWRLELAQQVLELREPYRRTIIAYYYEGQSTAQIARSEESAESTIRVRLARSIRMLRRRLEKRHDGRWLPALLILNGRHGGDTGPAGPQLPMAKEASTETLSSPPSFHKRASVLIICSLIVGLMLFLFLAPDPSDDSQSSRQATRSLSTSSPKTSPVLTSSELPETTESVVERELSIEELKSATSSSNVPVTIHVVDARTGEPVPHASVYFADEDQSYMGTMYVADGFMDSRKRYIDYYEKPDLGKHHGHTDESGQLPCSRRDLSRLGLVVSADGYVNHTERHRVRTIESGYEVQLEPAWQVAVKVLDPDGNAVEDANVSFISPGHDRQSMVTDTRGEAFFSWSASQSVVHVTHPRWARAAGLASSPRTVIQLLPRRDLKVRVRNASGEPVSQVELMFASSTMPLGIDTWTTDSNGGATLTGIPASGVVRVMASHPLYPWTDRYVTAGSRHRPLELVLPNSSYVDLRVLHPDGTVQDQGEVRILRDGNPPHFEPHLITGEVTQVGPLAPGKHHLVINQAPYAPIVKTIDLSPGEVRACEIHLAPGESVSGRVRDELGNPVENAALTIQQSLGVCLTSRVIRTDEEGRFVSRALVGGPSRQLLVHSPLVLLSSVSRLSKDSESQETTADLRVPNVDVAALSRSSQPAGTPARITTPTDPRSHATMGTLSFVPNPIVPLPPDHQFLEITIKRSVTCRELRVGIVDLDEEPVLENTPLLALLRDGNCVSLGVAPLDTHAGTFVTENLDDSYLFAAAPTRTLAFHHIPEGSTPVDEVLQIARRQRAVSLGFSDNGVPLAGRPVVASPEEDWKIGVLVGFTDDDGRLETDLLGIGSKLVLHVGDSNAVERAALFPRVVPLERCSEGLQVEILPETSSVDFELGSRTVSRR